MNEINRMLKLFDDLQQGDCWIGNNFKDTLQGINADRAIKTVNDNTNSPWHLVVHINYWRSSVINRLKGSLEPPAFPDFVLPPAKNEETWQRTLHEFESIYQSLCNAIRNTKEENLDQPSPKEGQTFYQLIMGCLQHDAYHLGQIVLIKKSALAG